METAGITGRTRHGRRLQVGPVEQSAHELDRQRRVGAGGLDNLVIVIGQQGFQHCSGNAAMADGGGAHECDRIGGQGRDNVGWQIGLRAAIVRRGSR